MSIHTACNHVVSLPLYLGWSWKQKTLHKSNILVKQWQLQFSTKAFNETSLGLGLKLVYSATRLWVDWMKILRLNSKCEMGDKKVKVIFLRIHAPEQSILCSGFESNLFSYLFSYIPIYPNLTCVVCLSCIQLLEHPIPASRPRASQKPPSAAISKTERGIIDPLVSKRLKQILNI